MEYFDFMKAIRDCGLCIRPLHATPTLSDAVVPSCDKDAWRLFVIYSSLLHMTRKQTRLTLILGSLAALAIVVGMVLFAAKDSIVFFYTPSDLAEKGVKAGTRIRIGGMVVKGSWKKQPPAENQFEVTDTLKTISVSYTGLVPDLFREGQGVVTEGVLGTDGSFKADTVLAKHDEKYMPKEIADSLKARGVKLGVGAGGS
jgi:cytochrome c-type biogenesis protein CcmE